MDLSLFFNALPEEMVAETESYSDLYFASEIFSNAFPRIQANSVALIGLPDLTAEAPWEIPDAFRRQFYSLKRTARTVLFYDLGNLRPGQDQEETGERLAEVCRKLVEKKCVPVLLGGNREYMLPHFSAFLDGADELNIANIDSTMDLDHEEGVLHRVVTMAPTLPSHFCQIGYQSYLVDPMGLSVIDRLHFESIRLGQIHENFKIAEPLIRDSDLLYFNLSALRNTAFGAAPGTRPFGLNGEQACQLSWYAGTSPRLGSVGFYNILPRAARADTDMATLAIMVWHFLEGFSYRHHETPTDERTCEKYTVTLNGYEDLLFYRSQITDRWWMLVPNQNHGGDGGYLLPCLYEDYIQAANGHLPDRWLKTFGRIN